MGNQPRVTWRLLLCIISALMGSFQFGYNSGVTNAPKDVIKQFINQSHFHRTGSVLSTDDRNALWSLLVAIFAAGGMIGAFLSAFWSEKFGRKKGMSINSWIGVVAGVLMFTSFYAFAYEMIIVGRLIVGIHCGLYTGLVPLYLSEIAYSDVRGALGTAHQLGITIGIFISQILGYPEILGTTRYWNILLGLTAFPALLQFILFYFCPESPRYLLIAKKNKLLATKGLSQLRGSSDVSNEIDEISNEQNFHSTETKMGIIQVLRDRSLRWPLVIAVVMQLSNQLSGINAVIYYSTPLFERAGLSSYSAQHVTSGVGAILVVMTLISVPLMDRVGRRPLHIIGLSGMFVCTVFLTLSLVFQNRGAWLKIASVVVLLIYIAFFSIGPGSIPWLIISELFTYGPRAAAVTISVLVNWILNFLVGYLFPYMEAGLGAYCFVPFSVMLALFVLFMYKYLPETKKRSFIEITAEFIKSPASDESIPTEEETSPLLASVQ